MQNIFSAPYLGKKQVLVVDNVIDHSQLLVTILEMEGYQVDTADGGHMAISTIEANPPHLVLLDLIMPEVNGIEVTEWIRQNQPEVAVIIVTSDYDESKDLLSMTQIDGLLTKPIEYDSTISTVEAIFSSRNVI